jgi:ComF family protein
VIIEFPAWCLSCRRYTPAFRRSGSWLLCRDCFDRLPFYGDDHCQKCGLSHPTVRCDQLWAQEIDRFWALFRYEDPVQRWLIGHKYSRDLVAGRLLRYLVEDWLAEHRGLVTTCDLLVPVPLHRYRLRLRGFNQTTFLLRSQKWVPIDTAVLRKSRSTPHQAGLSRRQRLRNLGASFEVCRPLDGRSVLVFDDVCTTGRTLGEIARTLRGAGAGRIWVLALCRAP